MQQLKGQVTINDGFTPALKSMANGMTQLLGLMDDMAQSTGHAFDEKKILSARSSIDSMRSSLSKIGGLTDENAKSQREHNRAIKEGEGNAVDFLGVLKRVGAALAIGTAVKSSLALSNSLINDEARLKMMIKDGENVNDLQKKIFESANRSSASYQATLGNIAKMGMQAGNAFKNNDQVIAFTENLNKAFSIAGSTNDQKASAVYNMTQALSAGVLRGQDFNAIMQSAPNIFDYVADYMAKTGDKSADYYRKNMREMAFQGKLTGDLIVNSMIAGTDKINQKFESMPFNFENQMTRLHNYALMGFKPMSDVIKNVVNSQDFIKFIDGIGTSLLLLGKVSGSVADFIGKNWSWVRWILVGIAVVIAGLVIPQIKMMALSALQFVAAFALAHPHLLLIAAGIALIGGVLDALGISVEQVFQFIIAGLYEIAAAGVNTFVFIGNLAITVVEGIVNGWHLLEFAVAVVWYNMQLGAINAFNAISLGFAGFINGLIEKFEGFLNFFIDGWNMIIDAINSVKIDIPDWVPGIGGKSLGFNFDHASRASLGRVEAKTIDTGSLAKPTAPKVEKFDRLEGMDMGWDTAMAFGKGVVDWGAGVIGGIGDKIGELMDGAGLDQSSDLADMKDLMNDIAKNTGDGANAGKGTKKNTDRMAKKKDLDRISDNLDYLKSISERRSIINLTWDKLDVAVTNSFGDVHETADLDGWLPTINDALGEAINASVGSLVIS